MRGTTIPRSPFRRRLCCTVSEHDSLGMVLRKSILSKNDSLRVRPFILSIALNVCINCSAKRFPSIKLGIYVFIVKGLVEVSDIPLNIR